MAGVLARPCLNDKYFALARRLRRHGTPGMSPRDPARTAIADVGRVIQLAGLNRRRAHFSHLASRDAAAGHQGSGGRRRHCNRRSQCRYRRGEGRYWCGHNRERISVTIAVGVGVSVTVRVTGRVTVGVIVWVPITERVIVWVSVIIGVVVGVIGIAPAYV